MVISIGDYVKNFHPKVCSSKESEHPPMPVSLEDHENGPHDDPPAALQLAA
jgi:hypothetical protein